MEVKAHFLDGRAYFSEFNKDNDMNPMTHRGGVNFYRFNLIGRILCMLGFAYKINYRDEKKHGATYLNSKSFKAWKERHMTDPGLDIDAVNRTFSQKNFEETIKIISENFAGHHVNIIKNKNDDNQILDASAMSWKIPFTYEEVVAKAEEQFTNLPYKEEILATIKYHLEWYKKSGNITLEGSCKLFDSEEERKKGQTITEGLDAFFHRNDIFREIQVCTLGGHILGHRRFINEVMDKAEIYAKEMALLPGQNAQRAQSQLLNYIRNTVFKQEFVKDPKAYIEKWKQARELEQDYTVHFPEDAAREFFEQIISLD